MYKKHSLLKQPKNSRQKLWRYLNYKRLLEVINDGFLYFCHVNKMKDQWEGLLTDKTIDKLFQQEYQRHGNAEEACSFVDDYEDFKDAFYINSWHMNDNESYLMWKVYGNRGFAIQTNYERLVASFGDDPPEINGCVMSYIDYESDCLPLGNTFYSVAYKDLSYRDEKEFRLLYWKTALANQNFPVDENGVKINVDANMLIQKIYINPNSTENTDSLYRAIENNKIDCDIVNSRIKEKA